MNEEMLRKPAPGPMTLLVPRVKTATGIAVYLMSDGRISPFFLCCDKEQFCSNKETRCCTCGKKWDLNSWYRFIPTDSETASLAVKTVEHISKTVSEWTGIPEEQLQVEVNS